MSEKFAFTVRFFVKMQINICHHVEKCHRHINHILQTLTENQGAFLAKEFPPTLNPDEFTNSTAYVSLHGDSYVGGWVHEVWTSRQIGAAVTPFTRLQRRQRVKPAAQVTALMNFSTHSAWGSYLDGNMPCSVLIWALLYKSRQIPTSLRFHFTSVETRCDWHFNQVHDINRARKPKPGSTLRQFTKSQDEETLNEGDVRRWVEDSLSYWRKCERGEREKQGEGGERRTGDKQPKTGQLRRAYTVEG